MPRRTRLQNIIIKMADGDEFYTSGDSPRISKQEIKQIQTMTGLALQTEHTGGAESGHLIAVYPLDSEKFRAWVKSKKGRKFLEGVSGK